MKRLPFLLTTLALPVLATTACSGADGVVSAAPASTPAVTSTVASTPSSAASSSPAVKKTTDSAAKVTSPTPARPTARPSTGDDGTYCGEIRMESLNGSVVFTPWTKVTGSGVNKLDGQTMRLSVAADARVEIGLPPSYSARDYSLGGTDRKGALLVVDRHGDLPYTVQVQDGTITSIRSTVQSSTRSFHGCGLNTA